MTAPYKITLPLNIEDSILQPFLNKMALATGQDYWIANEWQSKIINHKYYENILNDKFVPLLVNKVINSRISKVAYSIGQPIQLTNAYCKTEPDIFSQPETKMMVDCTANEYVLLSLITLAFGDDLDIPSSDYKTFAQKTSIGLSKYIVNNHYSDLEQMFSPLLDDATMDELDYYVQEFNISKDSARQLQAKISPNVKELERKNIQISVDYSVVEPISLHRMMKYALSTLNSLYGEGKVDDAINGPVNPIDYVVKFLDDCYCFLDHGALMPSVLYSYIIIHRNRHDAVLSKQLDSIYNTIGYYKGDCLDPGYTTVCFDMAVTTVAACYKL